MAFLGIFPIIILHILVSSPFRWRRSDRSADTLTIPKFRFVGTLGYLFVWVYVSVFGFFFEFPFAFHFIRSEPASIVANIIALPTANDQETKTCSEIVPARLNPAMGQALRRLSTSRTMSLMYLCKSLNTQISIGGP
jgi:hypothetical protein